MKPTIYTLFFLFLLWACEKKPTTNTIIEEKTVSSENIDTSRLTNYNDIEGNNSDDYENEDKAAIISRAAPAIPKDAIDMSSGFEAWKVEKKDKYYLPTGASLTTDLKYDDNVYYYIQGELTVNSAWGSDGRLYILEGGTVNYNTGNITQDTRLQNYGILNLGNNISISNKSTIYNYGHLNASGRTTFDGGLLSSEGTASFGQVIFNQKAHSGTMTFYGCVTADDVEINNTSNKVRFMSFLDVKNDILHNAGNIVLGAYVILECDDFYFQTANSKITGDKTKTSVIDAHRLIIKNKNTNKMFSRSIDIHADINNQSGSELKWQSSILFKDDTYIEGDGCKPSFGSDPDAGPTHTLVHISELSPAEADLSATALSFDDDLTYVSWHKKGPEYKGWIDLMGTDIIEDQEMFTIKASYSTPEIDYNSLYNSPSSGIIVSGGNATGALVGFIDYSPGAEGNDLSLESLKLGGASSNYILEKNNQLYAVSGGKNAVLATINLDEKQVTSSTEMPYLKCIFDHNNDIYVLYDVKSGDAKIKNIVTNDEFSVGSIDPIDGKNTCTIDDDGTIYVPMGRNGMKVFKDGVELATFIHPDKKDSGDMANAVSVDDNFIYVAYGTLGLVVLDKTDYRIIANYNCYDDASCNYVLKRDNGLLYVAYGLNGLHILKLEELE